MPSLLWTSDLHLDHLTPSGRESLLRQIGESDAASVLITGDLSVAAALIADLESIADAAARPLHFVLGNHDHFGSTVAQVRDSVLELGARRPDIQWLPPADVQQVANDTVLIGVDGWADGRHGDPLATPLVLNDDRLIGELAAQRSRHAKLMVKRALADADAARLAVLIDRAALKARRIIVATHVPPFIEALPRSGRLSSPDWLPLLVCRATGDVLTDAATKYPQHEFIVLAGHTHVGMDVTVSPNLRCRVASARYGAPTMTVVSV